MPAALPGLRPRGGCPAMDREACAWGNGVRGCAWELPGLREACASVRPPARMAPAGAGKVQGGACGRHRARLPCAESAPGTHARPGEADGDTHACVRRASGREARLRRPPCLSACAGSPRAGPASVAGRARVSERGAVCVRGCQRGRVTALVE